MDDLTHVIKMESELEVIQSTILKINVFAVATIRMDCIEADVDELTKYTDKVIGTVFPKWVSMSIVMKVRSLMCFEQVRELMVRGTPATEVGRFIQSQGEMKHMTLNSLRNYLEHYRATLPSYELAAKQQPKQYLDLKQKADQTFNVLERLQEATEWMRKRLKISFEHEERFGMLVNGGHHNYQVYMEMCEKVQDFMDNAGLTDKRMQSALPKTITDQLDWDKIYPKQSVGRVMNNPESRNRMIQFLERGFEAYGPNLDEKDLKEPE